MAVTFHLTCSDGTWVGGTQPADGTCTAGAWTMTGTGNSSWRSTAAVLQGGTAFLTFTYSGTGTVRFGDHTSSNDQFYTGSQTNVSMGTQGAGSMTIYDDASYVGTLTGVCITDTSGACQAGAATPTKALLGVGI